MIGKPFHESFAFMVKLLARKETERPRPLLCACIAISLASFEALPRDAPGSRSLAQDLMNQVVLQKKLTWNPWKRHLSW